MCLGAKTWGYKAELDTAVDMSASCSLSQATENDNNIPGTTQFERCIQQTHGLHHIARWEPYDLHNLAHVFWGCHYFTHILHNISRVFGAVPVFSVPIWMSYRTYRSVRYRY